MLGTRWVVVLDGLPAEMAASVRARVERSGGEVHATVQPYTDWLVTLNRGSRAYREALILRVPVVAPTEFIMILSSVDRAAEAA